MDLGFFIWDIHLKSAISLDCRFWQEICSRNSIQKGLVLEHISVLIDVCFTQKKGAHHEPM
jgi:hypothetical protein